MLPPPVLILNASLGSLAVIAGVLALCLPQGGVLHRTAGALFVLTVTAAAAAGAWGAAAVGESAYFLGSLSILYFTATAYLSVARRQPRPGMPELALGLFGAGIAAGAAAMALGGAPLQPGYSASCYLAMAAATGTGAFLDARALRRGGPTGRSRLVRHLWRMSFALMGVTSSVFTGSASVYFPSALRELGILAVPELAVLALGLYWVVRVRLTDWQPGGHARRAMIGERRGAV